jgi:site-specific DNA-methyltransferase (adenine-specific)
MTKLQIIQGDCLKHAPVERVFDMVFADPPDNIGLDYGAYDDRKPFDYYVSWLRDVLEAATFFAPIVWVSFNAKYSAAFGGIVHDYLLTHSRWMYRACVQTFTFGQHNHKWLGNNHRPLWCIYREDAEFYPDAVRVESWRQKNGDKRADPRGRVPGDVFDFTRVVGNSKQRRSWHPTQLNEGLVERCVLFSTPPGGSVLDMFAGTGTTLRVCQRLGRDCTGVEIDGDYCRHIREELKLGEHHVA